jgi:hypothetical protein
MKSSAAVGDSCHIHSSSPLSAVDQVQGTGYSESKVETDVAALQLETSAAALKLETDAAALELELNIATLELKTDTTALDLKMETDVPHGLSKQERYSVD